MVIQCGDVQLLKPRLSGDRAAHLAAQLIHHLQRPVLCASGEVQDHTLKANLRDRS
jgi:hypothetical protein